MMKTVMSVNSTVFCRLTPIQNAYVRTRLMFWSAQGKQRVMSTPNSCVVVCVNVLGWGQVDVRSTQNSCVVVCVNVLGWGQMEVSKGENIGCFSWLSSILSISNIHVKE